MTLNLSKRMFFNLTYCYISIPILIFLLGWMKLIYAIPLVAALLCILYKVISVKTENESILFSRSDQKKLLIILVIILIWVLISGIGKLAYQTEDHLWRNAMFETLVNEDWPIIKQINVNGVTETRGMSYYIGFWLPCALVGKVFGLKVGFLSQIVWAVFGIALFYYGVCILLKKIRVLPLIIFILFSGMDIIGYYLIGEDLSAITQTQHLEWWTLFQFSSNTTQLFWVFNQAIPAWLIVIALLLNQQNRNIGLFISAALICCTLPLIGMLPIVAYQCLNKNYQNKKFGIEWWRSWIKDTVSYVNLFSILISVIFFLYLIKTSDEAGGIGLFSLQNGGWLTVLVFLLVEIGGIVSVCYFTQRNNPLFYICVLWLCACPLIKAYGGDNFCMRASIPALTVLFIYFVQSIYEIDFSNKYYAITVLAVIFFGAITPLNEIVRNISNTQERYIMNESVNAASVGTDKVLQNDYESTDCNKNLFFQYLAK